MISMESSGSFSKTESFLTSASKLVAIEANVMQSCAQEGVNALRSATPKNTGLAASSWGYEIFQSKNRCSITWTNTDVENKFPVVIMLQYGHGTRGGGYIQGRDFINPAIKPVFDKIADRVWKAVTSA